MEALDESPFSETPVDVVTFVTGEKYLNQPNLSEYQYTLVECMSQIYQEKDIIRYMGEEAGKEHYKKYTKSEIIMQLGKGSGKDYTDLNETEINDLVKALIKFKFKPCQSLKNCFSVT